MDVFDFFNRAVDWISGEWWNYAVILVVSMVDAFFPLVPSESVVITAGVVAGAGKLSLPLVILAAAGGAIIGDNISYGLGSWLGERTVKRWFRTAKSRRAFGWAEHQLEARGFYLIVIARFIPMGRTAVTFASGYTHGMPWRKFIVADVAAGLIWASYAACLGYFGGRQFEDDPWKGLLLAFVIAVGLATAIEVGRNLRERRAQRRAAP